MIVLLVATVAAIAHALFGVAAATVVGGLLTALVVKLFDKIEFHPAEEIRFGAPLISVPWIYSALASVLILYGSRIGVDLARYFLGPAEGQLKCSNAYIAVGMAADWGMVVVGGWIIGRLFPERAMGLATLVFLILLADAWTTYGSIGGGEFYKVYECLFGAPASPDELDESSGPFFVGAALGLATRGWLTLVFARIASRRSLPSASA